MDGVGSMAGTIYVKDKFRVKRVGVMDSDNSDECKNAHINSYFLER